MRTKQLGRKHGKNHYCTESGKPKYSGVKTALTAANRVQNEKEINLFIYKCKFCNNYHLTRRERTP